ncbi:MAG: MFS transporter [Ignavibacteria bacterium]|nr:MFS transporter [Ignavibacteria bacterium]MCU7502906.1 MFS transporter [Ignavibacteria bacterium]MCU7515600.1 MFS transporter [Ignavibacteria bacterium]
MIKDSDTPKDNRVKRDSKEFNKIARGIFLSGLSCFMQLYLFQPILPSIGREFSINPAESSLTVSFSTIGIAAGLFAGALFADRLSRKHLIGLALVCSSVLTVLSSFVTLFPVLICINMLKGFFLSGSASVAMTYIAEEIHPSALGKATSLYITGNAIGGMSGRIIATLITGWLSWRWAAGIIGILCFIFGLLFTMEVPSSKHFKPYRTDAIKNLKAMGTHLRNPLLLSMYILAGLNLGSFVSIYNYLAFRMQSAPFFLPHEILAALYLMYLAGSAGSITAGALTDKFSSQKVMPAIVAFLLLGLLLMLAQNLILVMLGLGIFTASFFGTHTTASKIVAQHSFTARPVSISLFFLFYYAGSSLLGTSSGVIMHQFGWTVFIFALCAVCMLILFIAVFFRRWIKKPTGTDPALSQKLRASESLPLGQTE